MTEQQPPEPERTATVLIVASAAVVDTSYGRAHANSRRLAFVYDVPAGGELKVGRHRYQLPADLPLVVIDQSSRIVRQPTSAEAEYVAVREMGHTELAAAIEADPSLARHIGSVV